MKYIDFNKDKFKNLKIKDEISFDSTNEEVKVFMHNFLDFKLELNDFNGKKLLKLKEDEMQKLGMKFGQRKRLINAQNQFMMSIFERINTISKFNLIFDNLSINEFDKELTYLLNKKFNTVMSKGFTISDNEYKYVFNIIDNILIINHNNLPDVNYILKSLEINLALAFKYYLYSIKFSKLKFIFNELTNHISEFFFKGLQKLSEYNYSEYFKLKDLHLNRSGYQLISQQILDFIKNGLSDVITKNNNVRISIASIFTIKNCY
jgi:hypothetical protein